MIIVLLLIGALLDTIGIGLIFAYLSFLTGNQNVAAVLFRNALIWFGGAGPSEQAVIGGLLMLAAYLIKNVYLLACFWFLASISSNFFSKMVGGIYFHLLRMPYLSFAARKPAELSKIINHDSYLALHGVVGPALFLSSDVFAFLFLSITLAAINPVASIAAFGVAGVCGVLLFLGVKGLVHRFGKERAQNVSHLNRWVTLTLSGYKEIRAYRKADFFIQGFERYFSRVTQTDRIMRAAEQLPRLLSETLLIVAFVLVLLILVLMGVPVQQQVPVLAAFAVAGSRLVTSINRVMTSFQTIQYYSPAFEALTEEYNASAADVSMPSEPIVPSGHSDAFQAGAIRLEHLSFRYPTSGIVLDDLSLSIGRGSSVAFVGHSGAGKSTLIDLLLGLMMPTGGRVTVGAADIRENLPAWQRRIGYIPQHVYLIDDSIRANVAFGIPRDQVDDASVWRALDIAQLREFVSSLPNGLESFVGENGLSLSGGQRQRVSVARAFYNDPDVLLLDEATAALDNLTERALTDALVKVAGRKTLIYVAHRLTSIQHCDYIYFLEKGRIIASGSYRELLERSPEFRRMANAPLDLPVESSARVFGIQEKPEAAA